MMKQIPTYWFPHLEEKIKKIKNHVDEGADDGFVFMTDMHSECSQHLSPVISQYIMEQTGIDRVIVGGDLINGNKEKEKALAAYDALLAELKPLRPYFVRGNHDQNTDWGPITPENFFYDAIYRERVMGIAANECVPGKFYGHMDVPAAKLRYFLLDTGARYSEIFDSMDDGYDWATGDTPAYDEQLAYVKEKTAELPADWGIIVVQHIVLGGCPDGKELIMDIRNQYLLDCLDEIATTPNSPSVVGVFCGHNHLDRMIIANGGYPVIALTCDAGDFIASNWDYNYPIRTPGTTNEQAFDVVQIDRKNRTIYMTRIGAGQDRICHF
ncbi:MAG: metallophosphoesterase [Clostridia bacterium]|nr:metallophosphoesterase [Clostridia bacterium]